ncbi:MFS transporter [Gulosibacter sp. 10]|uniref:MFS transporter n=1 Tax=Gulosibacter sp. 10 TaxID=1255570 RepID=UPI00097F3B77|nr:MFS transporter [Gulosibacter sp. 10]SJM68248.1 Probable MFS-transporter [Gulosibacter sp. 10]
MSRLGARVPGWLLVAPEMFLLAWGGNHFTPLLHLYTTLGHYEQWQANLLLGMYVFGLAPGLMVASALSDRHGRKPVFLAGVALSLLGSLLLGMGLHSYPLLCIGRVLAGIGVGVAMSVGTAWVKELSSPPFEDAGAVAGARRPSLTITLGFALGAGVTGVLAQFAPMPAVLPYIVHGALSLAALPLVLAAPESRAKARTGSAWWHDLRVPAARHRDFVGIIAPAAPWVFTAASVAYAVVPASAEPVFGDMTTIFATILTVVTLGTGAVVQSFAMRIDRATGGRGLQTGLIAMAGGLLLAAAATGMRDPVLSVLTGIVLGGAYGLCMTTGLGRVQRIAVETGSGLAGLTGVYYALTYIGFLLPTPIAALLPVLPYFASLAILAGVCLLCLAIVQRNARRAR